ncbi:uncharacterized protein LDX57_008313 [Aspergillus melleus]|uniref:uncharacterized protein n=1 Tax=Aspergillus melleus TaxID=138277 RepID=UPI001E8D64D8|nr:uncharacterized protein LDX57_008313 [Aspergillus melleus]KAH8430650.1 hypothetical protein LDX57_008313 [Aspergillus melleus]
MEELLPETAFDWGVLYTDCPGLKDESVLSTPDAGSATSRTVQDFDNKINTPFTPLSSSPSLLNEPTRDSLPGENQRLDPAAREELIRSQELQTQVNCKNREIRQLNGQLKAKEGEVRKLRSLLGNDNDQKSKKQHETEEIKDLKSRLSFLQEEIKILKKEVEILEKERDQIQTQLEESQAKSFRLEEQLIGALGEQQRLLNQLRESRNETHQERSKYLEMEKLVGTNPSTNPPPAPSTGKTSSKTSNKGRSASRKKKSRQSTSTRVSRRGKEREKCVFVKSKSDAEQPLSNVRKSMFWNVALGPFHE